jgi:transposase
MAMEQQCSMRSAFLGVRCEQIANTLATLCHSSLKKEVSQKWLLHPPGWTCARGEVVIRKKCSRNVLRFTANLHVSLIGMEACGGAHFLASALREQRHDARLMLAKYVKPYVKTNKNDNIDAEAIAKVVGRPRMRFVPINVDDQLDLQHSIPIIPASLTASAKCACGSLLVR